MNQDNKKQQDHDNLIEFCQRLIRVANSLHDVRIESTDDLGFMGLCFLSKQTQHLQTIVALTPNKDTQLIARSMIEGMCQLFWVDQAPKQRAFQWRAFAWVNDWRLMQEQEKIGEKVSEERKNELDQQLSNYADCLMKPKLKKLKMEGKPVPSDPYFENWRCGVSIKDMCNDIGGAELYDKLYGSFSDWQHWGVGSLGAMLEKSGNAISYVSQESDSDSSLAVGFQCLVQTLLYLDDHLKLGLNDDIEKIKKE